MARASKAKYFLLCLTVFVLSAYLYFNAITYAILLYILAWLIEGGLKSKLRIFLSNKYALLFSGLYILYCIGIIYAANRSLGLFELQVKLSLLVFPVLLVSQGKVEIKQQKQLMYAFIAGCVVNGIISLGNAIWKYYALNVFEFEYKDFSYFMHRSYFAMYIDMALLFIYYLLATPPAGTNKWARIFLLCSFFFLVFVLV